MFTEKEQQALSILNLSENPVSGRLRNNNTGHECNYDIQRICFILTKENIPLSEISNPSSMKIFKNRVRQEKHTSNYFKKDSSPFEELLDKCNSILNNLEEISEKTSPINELPSLTNDIKELSIAFDSKAKALSYLKEDRPPYYVMRLGEAVRVFAYILKSLDGVDVNGNLSDDEINQLNALADEAILMVFLPNEKILFHENELGNMPTPTLIDRYCLFFKTLRSRIKHNKFYLE